MTMTPEEEPIAEALLAEAGSLLLHFATQRELANIGRSESRQSNGGFMSGRNDHAYYAGRAEQERARASSSKCNAAAMAHFQIAEEYERRARTPANGQARN